MTGNLSEFPAIKTMPVEGLIPYARNSRTHSEEQVAQIAASIKEFGFLNPIIVDGSNGIVAGHGRVLAARKLGMTELPCVEASHLTDTQRRAYVIADNKLALNAGWDDEALRVEFAQLSDDGFDLEITGFSLDEIGALQFGEAVEIEMPNLKSGDKEPFQQVAFTLHDEQVESVKTALELSKSMGEFFDSLNSNSNGNAIARICEMFVTQNANSQGY